MARIVEATRGKTRDKPISQRLRRVLDYAARAAGIDVVRVTSGGQAKKGAAGKRTGSIRHDLGNAADLQLERGGRTLDFTKSADRAVFESFVAASRAAGATGIGAGLGYMGPSTIHVGFGGAATWGAGGASANAPDWLRSAYATGAANPVDVGASDESVAARADAINRIASLGFSGPNAIRNFQAAQGFKGKDLDGILGPKTTAAALSPNVATASGARQYANLMGGAPLVAGVSPAPGSPVPPNAIPGVPDPSAPVPRASPVGRLSPEYATPGTLTQTATSEPDASAEVSGKVSPVAQPPTPRARPSPIEQTIARVMTRKGVLKKGAKGKEVAEVQRVLNAMGVTDSRGRPLEVDERLGPRTRQAIANYQSRYSHLVNDGVLGQRTLAQMMNDLARTTAPTMEAGQILDPGMAGSEMASPVAQIAANMGTDLAMGFRPSTASPGPFGDAPLVAMSFPTPGGGAFTPTLSPGPRGDSPQVAMAAGLPAQPSQSRAFAIRDADAMEAMSAFTPHGSSLGRGLSFDTLNRDGDTIYSAAAAFARQRVNDRELFGDVSSRRDIAGKVTSNRDFEAIFGGSGDAFLRDSSGRRVFESGGTASGMGNPSRAAAKGAGFTDRGSSGGFTARSAQQAPRSASQSSGSQGASGRSGQSGTGQSSRSSSQAGTASRSTSSGVRRTGSFGHTSSGRPIGGV